MSEEKTNEKKPRASTDPVAEFAPSDRDFTPVTDVMELLDAEIVLTDREKRILHYMWRHSANQELRARQRRETGDTAVLERRIDSLETDMVDVRGKSGDNGKLGSLRQRVDAFLGRAWALVLLLLGGVSGVAVKLVIVGRSYGELETQVEANRARLQLLENVVFLKSLPALPEKELP